MASERVESTRPLWSSADVAGVAGIVIPLPHRTLGFLSEAPLDVCSRPVADGGEGTD